MTLRKFHCFSSHGKKTKHPLVLILMCLVIMYSGEITIALKIPLISKKLDSVSKYTQTDLTAHPSRKLPRPQALADRTFSLWAQREMGRGGEIAS